MIHWLLAIWLLLPFLNPACRSRSPRFTYCWSLAWRILSITLFMGEMSAMWSQVGLRKHHYEQNLWRWWNSILKDDAVKVLHSICQQIWKTQQWPQDWKRSIFIPIPKKGNAKECSNYGTVALISHTRKVMLKILQVRLQKYVNRELPVVQGGFRKGGGTRDQIVNICWIIGKAREFQKNMYFCCFDYAKAFDCVDHNKLENF